MKVTLSEVLVRRKELKARHDLFTKLTKQRNIFEPQVQRRVISDQQGIEQIDAVVPRTTREAVEREADYYSRLWRLTDGLIQQLNHTTNVAVPAFVMKEFVTDQETPKGEITETLAALLSRRKMLQQKVVEVFGTIDLAGFVTQVSTRKKMSEGIEDILNQDKVPAHALVRKQLFYLKAFKECEAAVARTNSKTEVDIKDELFQDFE